MHATPTRTDRRCLNHCTCAPRCLRDLRQVIIGNPDLKANHNITQLVEVMAEYDKYPRIRELLKSVMAEPGAKVGRGAGAGAPRLLGGGGMLLQHAMGRLDVSCSAAACDRVAACVAAGCAQPVHRR